jgi:hypothetical protein
VPTYGRLALKPVRYVPDEDPANDGACTTITSFKAVELTDSPPDWSCTPASYLRTLAAPGLPDRSPKCTSFSMSPAVNCTGDQQNTQNGSTIGVLVTYCNTVLSIHSAVRRSHGSNLASSRANVLHQRMCKRHKRCMCRSLASSLSPPLVGTRVCSEIVQPSSSDMCSLTYFPQDHVHTCTPPRHAAKITPEGAGAGNGSLQQPGGT